MGKEINVTTNGQSGGTTAGEININNSSDNKSFWQKPIIKYFIAPLTVLIVGGIAVGILIHQPTNKNMANDTFNVTSNNQQGGLTAGQVNVGKQDRQLTAELIQQLEQVLPEDKNKKILISPTHQDAETFRFADKIKNHLLSLGYINTTRFEGIKVYANQNWPADVNIFPDKDGKVEEIIVTTQR